MTDYLSGTSYQDFLPNGEGYDFNKWWDSKDKGDEDPEFKNLRMEAIKQGKLLSFKDGNYIFVDKEEI